VQVCPGEPEPREHTLIDRTGLSAAESFAELADLLFNGLRRLG
jgi:hypothetical protein